MKPASIMSCRVERCDGVRSTMILCRECRFTLGEYLRFLSRRAITAPCERCGKSEP